MTQTEFIYTYADNILQAILDGEHTYETLLVCYCCPFEKLCRENPTDSRDCDELIKDMLV